MSNNTADREVILSISHVDISFDVGGKKKFVAVKDANFDIYKGETFALVGESGSGKTTLGRAIMRINPCSNGEILFEGKRISGKISREEDRNVVRNIQMIFQDPAASFIRTRKSVSPRSIRRSRTSACCPSTSPVIRTSSPADSVSASVLPAR